MALHHHSPSLAAPPWPHASAAPPVGFSIPTGGEFALHRHSVEAAISSFERGALIHPRRNGARQRSLANVSPGSAKSLPAINAPENPQLLSVAFVFFKHTRQIVFQSLFKLCPHGRSDFSEVVNLGGHVVAPSVESPH